MAKEVGTAEPPVPSGRDQMRLEREGPIVAVGPKAFEQLRPASHALSRCHHRPIRAGVLHVYVGKPRTERVIGVGIRHLAAHDEVLSLIHISEPTRLGMISYAVFCLK